jgi:diaminohydroxyphosphoribosylaminopyrimidine deaminase/5-amino-6-(5-phosphoribosylamino)uracil reductase
LLTADERFMARALDLAARGLGTTNPNPAVGCVVVKGGRIVGEGWHRRAGGPHAEVLALARAGPRARGATLYVTLEPCSHHGRTPPCAPQVVGAGVKRVVVAMGDPNPPVSGRGLRLLRRAGVAVSVGVLGKEARRQNGRFLIAARRPRPYVLLKVATTLDGRIATRSGDSKWITSSAQRRWARRLRGLHDGVAVGIGTVLRDDPLLLPQPRSRRPFLRIVFDSQLRLPSKSRLVRSARQAPVWVLGLGGSAARRRALEAAGVVVVADPARGPRVSIPWALAELRRRGVWSLMVEGGSELLGAFLAARAFDHLALFRAPLLLGGRRSLSAFGGPDPARIDEALRLQRVPEDQAPPGLPGEGLCELWAPLGRRRGHLASKGR